MSNLEKMAYLFELMEEPEMEGVDFTRLILDLTDIPDKEEILERHTFKDGIKDVVSKAGSHE